MANGGRVGVWWTRTSTTARPWIVTAVRLLLAAAAPALALPHSAYSLTACSLLQRPPALALALPRAHHDWLRRIL